MSAYTRAGGIVAASLVLPATFALVLGLVVAGTMEDEDKGLGDVLNTKEVPDKYVDWIRRAGQQCPQISAPLIAAQIDAESGWRRTAQSPVGARGLSQFMPGTWRTWGVDAASKDGRAKPDGRADPLTPGDAIMTQARYDCWLARKVAQYKRTGEATGDATRLTLAAYNAGPDAIKRYHGMPPYSETQHYVQRILALRQKYARGDSGDQAAGPRGQRIIAAAEKWLGTPYAWGGGTVDGPTSGYAQGAGTKGFDCSSLVQYAVYHGTGKTVIPPRTSQAQMTKGKPVNPEHMRPGDVIGFALHGGGNWDHVGIYVGGGQMVEAPRTGESVKISSIRDSYYKSKPKKVRRY